jgi:glycosyltransferase involved in cell wall biosynthesis
MPRFIGGIETQLGLLAQGLAAEGCDVSLITYDHAQTDDQIIEGIRVLKAYRPDSGIRGLRWVSRAKQLWRAMEKADADIYLQMGAGIETGLVALGCGGKKTRRSKFVFCLASDLDFGASLKSGTFGWKGKIYRYGLRQASLIVAQTQRQRKQLKAAVALDARVIPMAAASPLREKSEDPLLNGVCRVAWVGRTSREKRLEWLLEVARRCPEVQFQIVGTANGRSAYAAEVMKDLKGINNVMLRGRLAAPEMHNIYRNAHILCNTSAYEGFPATFLEAWSYGLPVVTTFDPDDIVRRQELGRVAETVDGLVTALRELRSDRASYARISQRAKRYYEENHSVDVVSHRFRLAFEELLEEH